MQGQTVVTGFEVGIVLFTQTMPAIKFYPVQVFVSNKLAYPRVEGGASNEDIIDVSVISDCYPRAQASRVM